MGSATQPLGHHSIANRLRWTYLLSSILPLLLVGGLLLYLNLNSQESLIYNIQRNRTQRIASDIDLYLSPLRLNLADYANTVPDALSAGNLEFGFSTFLDYYPNQLISIALFDKTNREQLRMIGPQYKNAKRAVLPGDIAAVQKALHYGTISYGPISSTAAGSYSFLLTLPIRDHTQHISQVLQVEINADAIVYSVGTTDHETLRRTLLIDAATSLVMVPGDAIPITAEHLQQMKHQPLTSTEYMRSDGIAMVGSQVPVTIGEKNEQSGWMVVVDQPVATAFGSTRQSAVILMVFVIVAAFFSLLLAFWQSRRLLKPLNTLREGADALGAGHLDYRVHYTGNDEFGGVIRTFNHMAEQIQRSRNEIAQQNEHLRQGLTLARDIQLGLLPRQPPWAQEVMQVDACCIPAFEVGGDFYSYRSLTQDRNVVVIGDISGKGIGAALMMALVSSTLEAQRGIIEHPGQLLTSLNAQLLPRLKSSKMNAALLMLIFDPHKSLVRIANAGMIAPILISKQGSQLIDVGGLPLGSYDKAVYQEQSLVLHPGDTLLLVSDGIVEAHNVAGEMFGFERLQNSIHEANAHSVQDLVQSVMSDVLAHMAEAEPHDDMTIVAVRPMVEVLPTVLHKEQSIDYAAI